MTDILKFRIRMTNQGGAAVTATPPYSDLAELCPGLVARAPAEIPHLEDVVIEEYDAEFWSLVFQGTLIPNMPLLLASNVKSPTSVDDSALKVESIPPLLNPPLPNLAPRFPMALLSTIERAQANPNLICLSDVGADAAEKPINEDFACAAQFEAHGKLWTLLALSDGMSHSMIWPERGARLTVMATLQSLMQSAHRLGEIRHGQLTSHWCCPLVDEIIKTLGTERLALIYANAAPEKWDEDDLCKRSADLSNWFGCTLLFAAVAGSELLIGWCGDGGIDLDLVYCNGESRKHSVLTCDAGAPAPKLRVSAALNVHAIELKHYDLTDEVVSCRITLASDGITRNLAGLSLIEAADSKDSDLFQQQFCSTHTDMPDNISLVSYLHQLPEFDFSRPAREAVLPLSPQASTVPALPQEARFKRHEKDESLNPRAIPA